MSFRGIQGTFLFLLGSINVHAVTIPEDVTSAIYGRDNRFQMPAGSPWQAIGRVSQSDKRCTGTLVAACLVLTASHCVSENKATTFQGSNDGPTSGVKFEYYGGGNYETDWGVDWEILVLNTRLGDQLGWMGVRNWEGPDYNTYKNFTLAGYSADIMNGGQRASVDNAVSIHKTFRNNVIYHDANNYHGASGGPIFGMWDGHPYIVAVHTRSASKIYRDYTDDAASIGVASGAFLGTLKQAIARWCP